MAQETFYNLINQSMQESARLVRSSLGRSSYVISREKALAQVSMLEKAKWASCSWTCSASAWFFRDNLFHN